jgi:hypothetical protein
MPHLRVFRIHFDFPDTDPLSFEGKAQQFTSPFWSERQWFSSYQYYPPWKYGENQIYFSTDPYRAGETHFFSSSYFCSLFRRKEYTLCNPNNPTLHLKNSFRFVDHIRIRHDGDTLYSTNHFPNARKLTLEENSSVPGLSLLGVLSELLPLDQLTSLVLK